MTSAPLWVARPAGVPLSDKYRALLAPSASCGHSVWMTQPTHATLATFRMDPSLEAEQRQGLEQMIVPGVRQAPGFITGCWTLDRDTNESVVMITFDSIEGAEAFASNVRANLQQQAAFGIELLSIRVVEVTASA